jgi:pyruvate/2-oxoglutarate/acetoin dehydrogenase E1 component/TPP-dependent pyruvate/acetoin dehydrogenase alpha subunit
VATSHTPLADDGYFCAVKSTDNNEQDLNPALYQDLRIIPVANTGSIDDYKRAVHKDYWIAKVSREVSILSRKEVLNGRAKFGINGDGKELPQVVQARHFAKGDYRTGYYRDQTVVMALGECSVEDSFAQLYADPYNDHFSKGRQMNSHFATQFVDDNDEFIDLINRFNISADTSSTGGQMARALGLALASKKIREAEDGFGKDYKQLGRGDEVVFCNIGDASTSEGVFWETLNAATVLEVPLVISVWDDGYGISVPKKYQTTKASISEATRGFEINEANEGIYIYTVKGWDYSAMQATYEKAAHLARTLHKPVLVHIEELTQPQGHSTSGSHERYKSSDRLKWEADHDCIKKMGEWMISSNLATAQDIEALDAEALQFVKDGKKAAWSNYQDPIIEVKKRLLEELKKNPSIYQDSINELKLMYVPARNEIVDLLRKKRRQLQSQNSDLDSELAQILDQLSNEGRRYATDLISSAASSPLVQPVIHPKYSDDSETLAGYQIINKYFDHLFGENHLAFAFGEDVGQIGDVNQGFAGLQEKYGETRIFDCGIREWTIIGQAIGMAMRGLRPIAEIQYLDYLVYALSALTDDLATLRYRSGGLQIAPAIVRTRGHRLEGIWHSGSQMGLLLSSLRGMHLCVPRNFVQAAGMYQTLMQSTDPALVVEPLNAYRQKEMLPDNIGTYTIPLGSPEILSSGDAVTVVTYGSCVPIVLKAVEELKSYNISAEVIDVQTLMPFDLESTIGQSLTKTSRLVIVDEDVPGGASAYILQKILIEQDGYFDLDAQPITLTAKEHRPPFGSEGDYYTKPQVSDVVEVVLEICNQ